MYTEYLANPLILALIKVTAFLLIALVCSSMIKSPEAKSNLWTCSILAVPLIVVLSSTSPILKILTKTVVEHPPIEVEMTRLDGTLDSSPSTKVASIGIENTAPNELVSTSTKNLIEEVSKPLPVDISSQVAQDAPKPQPWLLIAYCVGALLTFSPFISSMLRILFLKKKEATGVALEVWRKARPNKNHKLYVTPAPYAPCAHGVISPKVLIPEDSKDWEPRRLLSTLSHEVAHLKRFDPIVRMVSALIKSAFWFHPLIWIAQSKLIQAQEESCDQRVLETGLNAEDYAEDLLFAATLSKFSPAESIAMAKWSQLGKRINKIITNEREKPITMKTQLSIITLSAGAACALATTGIAQTSTEVSSEKTISKITEAVKGGELSFDFKSLPAHQALEISFKAHFVGPWDGSGLPKWGPDRFLCEIDGAETLLDATFNNGHLVWPANIWQSFPDPHHPLQNDFKNAHLYLHRGGEGASAIASLGFPYSSHPSVDSSYTFKYVVKHAGDELKLKFLTKWNENVITQTLKRVWRGCLRSSHAGRLG